MKRLIYFLFAIKFPMIFALIVLIKIGIHAIKITSRYNSPSKKSFSPPPNIRVYFQNTFILDIHKKCFLKIKLLAMT